MPASATLGRLSGQIYARATDVEPSCYRPSVAAKSKGGGLVMHQYELMVILDPEIDERTVAPSLDKFLNVVRNDGGTVDNVDIWGRRRLAYEINKKTEGIYAVVQADRRRRHDQGARPPAEAQRGRHAHQGAPCRRGDRSGRRRRRSSPTRRPPARLPLPPRLLPPRSAAEGAPSPMAGETVITVVGNLTSDPELRYTQNGLAVANFTIASTPRTFDRRRTSGRTVRLCSCARASGVNSPSTSPDR